MIRLPISGSTTPRSTRSISPAYSTDSIIYHSRPSHSAGSLTPPLLSHSHSRSRSTSLINPSTPHTHRTRPPPTPLLATPSLSTSATPQKKSRAVVRPSLLGAIEFRDVVNSLSNERNTSFNARDVLGVLGGGGKEERGGGGRPGMHSRTHSSSSSRISQRRSPRSEGEGEVQWDWNGWGSASEGSQQQQKRRKRASTSPQGMGGGLRLQGEDDVLARGVLERMGGDEEDNETGSEGAAENPWEEELEQRAKGVKKVPSILLTSANGSDTLIPTTISNMEEGGSSSITVTGEGDADGTSTIRQSLKSPSSPPTRRIPSRRRLLLSATLSALFPSLDQFTSKSIIGKITAIMCVPALLVLNLTLPVAEEPSGEVGSDECWEEKEDEEDDRSVRGVPKGIRLPDDGTGDDGSLLERRSIDDGSSGVEEDRIGGGRRSIGGEAAERVGKKLHSPAVAHPHSHHLTNSHPHDPTQEALPSFPWSNPTSNLPTPQSNAPLHSPSSYFKIKTSSEQGTINRISSNSSGDDEGEEMSEEMEERLREREECLAGRKVTRCLTAVQCTLGPIFCTCALFGTSSFLFVIEQRVKLTSEDVFSGRIGVVSASTGSPVGIVLRDVGISILSRSSSPGKSHTLFHWVRNRDGLDLDDR